MANGSSPPVIAGNWLWSLQPISCFMRHPFFVLVLLLVAAATAVAQHRPLPQGSGIPGLSSIAITMDGPGYLEAGYGHSGLTAPNPNWNDVYFRGMISGGSNAFTGELVRQGRWGDSGWYGNIGWLRILNPDWYTDLYVGTSVGGSFLPRLRTDAFINRKLLKQRQLVTTFGFGYDRAKQINGMVPDSFRGHAEFAYYLQHLPLSAQAGIDVTRSQPGSLLARTQHMAVTYGHDKERYLTIRYEFGREAYEVLDRETAIFDFPIHNFQFTWREWIGFNWGLNFVLEHDRNQFYRRTGGSLGFFLDF
jgi:YaiO family outer membrane protein